MSGRKKTIVGFSVLFFIFLIWYLFIKKSDYIISFDAKTATTTVFQGIQEWSALQEKEHHEKYSIVEKRNFDFIKQKITKGDIQLEYAWDIESINDSVTQVSVGIKEANNSIYNRLTAPFFNINFKKQQIQKITNFKNGLLDHLKKFKVKIEGEGQSEETFVAYINLKSVMQEKGQTMIGNDAAITGFLQANHIKILGRPYVEIVHWDQDKEKLDFNYCFPINKTTKEIQDKEIKFKTLPVLKGLKATYYGNFRTSDKAWFALMDYAKRHGYKLQNKALEHFLANPFNGGDELQWETKIIIPFAKPE
jgi:effector-binding domain-containing protein